MSGASERAANGSHPHSSVHLVDDVDVRSYEPNSVVFNGVSGIPRSQFSALALSDAIEWDYIRAIERISSKDFQFLSIGLGDAKQLAAVAAFSGWTTGLTIHSGLGPNRSPIGWRN